MTLIKFTLNTLWMLEEVCPKLKNVQGDNLLKFPFS
jgi:hypothetical protein